MGGRLFSALEAACMYTDASLKDDDESNELQTADDEHSDD